MLITEGMQQKYATRFYGLVKLTHKSNHRRLFHLESTAKKGNTQRQGLCPVVSSHSGA